jgi:D-3-phosphoglycerate dehydrogenase / 2-oxoglutarate reductase
VDETLERWRTGWVGTGRIVVASASPVVWPETRSVLEGHGIAIDTVTLRDGNGALSADAAAAEVLISGGLALDADVFAQLRRARFVLRPYVGYDDIDVEAATRHGILVGNVPDTFIEEVANHTLALILAANRRLRRMDRFVRDGRWKAGEDPWVAARPVARLSLLTLGLVGFGNIARLVAERARPFGFRILAVDPYVAPESAAPYGVQLVSLEALLRESDLVSVHVLLTRETRHLLDATRLGWMKPTAMLVNTSRGAVVDEAALVDALRAGRLAGAALDVFEAEPLDPRSPLTQLEDVILAPHLASYSVEGVALHRSRVGQLALEAASGGLPERKVILNKDLYDWVAALPECARVTRY